MSLRLAWVQSKLLPQGVYTVHVLLYELQYLSRCQCDILYRARHKPVLKFIENNRKLYSQIHLEKNIKAEGILLLDFEIL